MVAIRLKLPFATLTAQFNFLGVKMFKNLFKLLVASALFMGTVAAASDTQVMDRVLAKKQLVVGTSGNMPPMTNKLQSGDVAGFDMDLAAMMAGALT